MKNLLKFLKSDYFCLNEESSAIEPIKFSISEIKDYKNKLNLLFKDKNIDQESITTMKFQPGVTKNQIWSIKNSYFDYLGKEQKASHPFIVWIDSESKELAKERFVRVKVVSPFVEFKADDDIFCNDSSIIGFPFIIETWNEQPILLDLIDNYLGYFELNKINLKNNIDLSQYQKEFRELEVSNAKYLNNSITTFLYFLEQKQAEDSGVVISLYEEYNFPNFYIGQNQAESILSLAAKTGADKEDKYLKYVNDKLPFEIYIRKNENGYIITVIPYFNIKLVNIEKEEIHSLSNKEKVIFQNLEKGIYKLISETLKEPLKIILR